MNTNAILNKNLKQKLWKPNTKTGNVYDCARYNIVKNELCKLTRNLGVNFEMNTMLKIKPNLFDQFVR